MRHRHLASHPPADSVLAIFPHRWPLPSRLKSFMCCSLLMLAIYFTTIKPPLLCRMSVLSEAWMFVTIFAN